MKTSQRTHQKIGNGVGPLDIENSVEGDLHTYTHGKCWG